MLKRTIELKGVSKEMKRFLLKLVIFIVVWQGLYIFVLKPVRIPDEFLTTTLTRAVTFSLNVAASGRHTWRTEEGKPSCVVMKEGKPVLVIFDDCNGFDLYIIYLAFILLLPYQVKRKILFSIAGVVAIFIGNIIRCISLYGLYNHYRSYFDFNHHYVFTIIMYLIIFYGWVLYTKPRLNEIR